MKKVLLMLLGVLMALPSVAQDFTYKYSGYSVKYSVIDEEAKTCKVAANNEIQGDLTLPSNPKNGEVEYTLVEIGENAFKIASETVYDPEIGDNKIVYDPEASKLTTVVLPSTLKSIGNYAFEGQGELYDIDFPEGLEDIGDYAFHDCKLLEFAGFPESLIKIGDYAFWNCSTQTSIDLPRYIQSLGKGAFREMGKLKKVVLFSDLETVPEELCANCPLLEALYLPQQVKVIGDKAFSNSCIEEVILPNTLEIIGCRAFSAESCPRNEDNNFIGGKISKITFPDNLREIRDYAFQYQPFFRLEFNEGLKKIGTGAFEFNLLSSLSLSSTIEDIGDFAFERSEDWTIAGEKNIGFITLPSSLKTIGHNLFEGYYGAVVIGSLNTGTGLTELNVNIGRPRHLIIGENVKRLSPSAIFFDGCKIKVLQLNTQKPPTVTETFSVSEDDVDNILVIVKDGTKDLYLRNPYWKVFGSSIVEESEASISIYVDGQYPISEEIRTQSGMMPSQVVKMKVNGKLSDDDWRLIRENMTSLISLDLSGISNIEIPDGAFEDKTLLIEIVLPAKLTRIGNSAFRGCSILNLRELPDGITEIGGSAFNNCKCITISKLPEALQELPWLALGGCSSITSLTAGPNLKHIDYNPCNSLEYVDLSASKIESLGGFTDCSNLTTIILPETVVEIENLAFSNTALTSFEIPTNVKFIGGQAFKNSKIRGITVPEGIESILYETFAFCPKLISVNLPQSLTYIETGTFSDDKKLMSISCRAINAPELDGNVYGDINRKKCSLTIPQQSFRSYLNAPGWGAFQNIINRLEVEFPEEDVDLTAIDEEEYQEIVEEEQLQQEAEESAQGEENGEGEDDPDQPTPQKVRAKARQQLINGTNFSRLFNGATVGTPNTAKGTRVFVNMKYDAELIALYYNDVDVTDQMEGNSYLLPSKADGNLSIKIKPSGIEDATPDTKGIDYSEPYEVYNLSGACLGNNIDAVAPGFYIVRQGSKACKVMKN